MELYDVGFMGKTYYYNTGPEPIEFNGRVYKPIPIEREEINLDIDSNGAVVTAPIDVKPFAYLVTNPNVQLPTIKIIKYPFGFTFFEGVVNSCEFDYSKRQVKLMIGSKYNLKEVTIPKRSYSSLCSFNFCDENCGLNIDDFKVELQVGEFNINGFTIQSDLLKNLYYDLISGFVVTDKQETQYITAYDESAGEITLLKPFLFTDIINIKVYYGCSKTTESCEKYNNISHFGGFPYIPQKNLSTSGF